MDFKLQQLHFSQGLFLDLPGHPKGKPMQRIEDYAEWVGHCLEKKGADDVVLVGHSMGGAIALTLALTHPPCLRGVVTVGSGARLGGADIFIKKLKKIVAQPKLYPPYLGFGYKKIDSQTARAIMVRTLENGPSVMLNDLMACNGFDITEHLDDIDVPFLALCGDQDIMTPPKFSEFLAAHIPGARFEIIPGGTHMVAAEQPREVNRAIEAFCKRIFQS